MTDDVLPFSSPTTVKPALLTRAFWLPPCINRTFRAEPVPFLNDPISRTFEFHENPPYSLLLASVHVLCTRNDCAFVLLRSDRTFAAGECRNV